MFRLFDSLQSLIFKAQSRRVNIDQEKRHIIQAFIWKTHFFFDDGGHGNPTSAYI